MKTRRTYAVLLMAFLLSEKGFFAKEDITSEMSLVESTFFLALSDFRCFLAEHRPHLELVFSPEKRTYALRKFSL